MGSPTSRGASGEGRPPWWRRRAWHAAGGGQHLLLDPVELRLLLSADLLTLDLSGASADRVAVDRESFGGFAMPEIRFEGRAMR
jgi:hypothetical protein